MTTDTSLTSRQALLLTLTSDLNALGWGQKHKLWHLDSDGDGEEWLTYVGEFSGAPETRLSELYPTGKSTLPRWVQGIVIASEGWAYPQRVLDMLDPENDSAAYHSHLRTIPPDEHPERVEIRHVLLVAGDGEVLAVTCRNTPGLPVDWASARFEQEQLSGDRAVDMARSVLGLALKRKALSKQQAEGLEVLTSLSSVVERAIDEDMTDDQVTRELFLSLPEEFRQRMVADMPDDIRAILRRVLSPEERNQYGL